MHFDVHVHVKQLHSENRSLDTCDPFLPWLHPSACWKDEALRVLYSSICHKRPRNGIPTDSRAVMMTGFLC